mmetsp:Transcript_163665/g.524823  ORF Transcript_163665/g.524823 Transcript_163665/m.524823 type:complete len:221 (-) Transcript_163665:1748-2410(-)
MFRATVIEERGIANARAPLFGRKRRFKLSSELMLASRVRLLACLGCQGSQQSAGSCLRTLVQLIRRWHGPLRCARFQRSHTRWWSEPCVCPAIPRAHSFKVRQLHCTTKWFTGHRQQRHRAVLTSLRAPGRQVDDAGRGHLIGLQALLHACVTQGAQHGRLQHGRHCVGGGLRASGMLRLARAHLPGARQLKALRLPLPPGRSASLGQHDDGDDAVAVTV